jgi:THO complex subunit 2
VTCCTENEAGRYGRFLSAMLDIVMKWHRDKDVFEAECSGLFLTVLFSKTGYNEFLQNNECSQRMTVRHLSLTFYIPVGFHQGD